MKHLYKIIAVLLLLDLCSCSDYLDVKYYTILPEDQMFKTESDAAKGLTGLYDCLFPNASNETDWNYKAQLLMGNHPTLDTQSTGWDVNWNRQGWTADNNDLTQAWTYSYLAVNRCNDFIAGMENSDAAKSWSSTKSMLGQAHALRGYFYIWLAENWGKVPMLLAGENYSNTPNKAAAATYEEMWNFIISDFKTASDSLEWAPYNGEYGRCTKGMALTYLADAYLWKAYRIRQTSGSSDSNKVCIKKAAEALKTVITSGTYDLAPSYSTLFDPGEAWPKEAVWQVVVDPGSGKYSTDLYQESNDCHVDVQFYSASPQAVSVNYTSYGGWGTEWLPWELYFSFENGDKRRDYSMCTTDARELPESQRSKYCYGYNPFLQLYPYSKKNRIYKNTWTHYFVENAGYYAPAIWSLKFWRTMRSNYSSSRNCPVHFYKKRYSNVLLDYAECLFRLYGNDNSEAWGYINQVRNRAFGNLEVGKTAELTAKFLPYYQSLPSEVPAVYGDYVVPTSYPIPFSTETATVPDAKTYYTAYAAENDSLHKSFLTYTDSIHPNGLAVWEVALGQERRKEFNSELYLSYDLQRSDFLPAHIECDFPKGVGYVDTDIANRQKDWHYYRDWDFNKQKLDMPIPASELLRNNLIKQNPGY